MHVDNPNGIPEEEVAQYVARAEDMISRGELPPDTCRLEVTVRGGEVDLRYCKPTDRGIDRIRRLTGYLVGTLDRWNSAKRAEERDRIKHCSKEHPELQEKP